MASMLHIYTLKTAIANRTTLRFFDSLTCPNHAHLVRTFNLPIKKACRFGKEHAFPLFNGKHSTFSSFDEDLSFTCSEVVHPNVPNGTSEIQNKKRFSSLPDKPATCGSIQEVTTNTDHKTVVLIHGFPGLWWSWKYQLESLTQSGYRVIALDLRGFGGSGCVHTPTEYDVFTIANDILHLLRELNICRFSIMAHGMGSEAGHFIALYAPDMVECIISLNYTYVTPSKAKNFATREREAGPTFDFMLSHIESAIEIEYEERMETLFRRLFAYAGVSCDSPLVLSPQRSAGSTIIDRLGEPYYMPHYFDSEDMQYYLENYRRTGFSGAVNHIRNKDINILKFTSLRSHIISPPSLVILGEHDILYDNQTVHQSADGYRDGSLKLISDGGPFLQLQKKDELNSYILPFLKKHANQCGSID